MARRDRGPGNHSTCRSPGAASPTIARRRRNGYLADCSAPVAVPTPGSSSVRTAAKSFFSPGCRADWVDGVPARKYCGPRELRLRHFVVVEAALLEQLVPRPYRTTVEPPFLAAKYQVAVGNVPHARGRCAVPVVQCHGDGLRRDDAAELGIARELLVPVQRIGVVHRHHPTANVRRAAGIPQLPPADGLAHAVVDVGQVELGAFGLGP